MFVSLRLARLFLFTITVAFAWPAEAQEGTITGRVTDIETGEPLFGAAVEVLGQAGVQQTDDLGRFRLSVSSGGHSVVVALIGYETQRVDGVDVVGGGTAEVDIALSSQALVLNPVVVTASRRQEKALDAPASVSTVSSSDIARVAATTPAEHVRTLPGIDMVQTGLTQSSIVARGFNNVFSGSMLTIIDNRYARLPSLRYNAHNMIPTTDLDIERIEVSLGPGAALYGPNATSGVMHIITSSPIDRPGTTVSMAGGERSVFHGQFRTAHAVSDQFGMKFSGQYFRGDDFEYVDPVEARIGKTRDNLNERYSADARFDFRFADDADLVIAGGLNVAASSIELTGVGAAHANGWATRYVQTRFSAGRFFAQAFLNQTDAGNETVLLRTDGDKISDESRALAFQIQHGFDVKDWQSFTYGVDWQRAEPRTNGTITGRNEDDDNISEVGAYIHSETALGDKLDLVTAIRGDDHSRLADPNISPRAALVFKPGSDQNFRLTFNRAFQTPGTNTFFLDIVAFDLNEFGIPYKLRALGVPPGGFTFSDQCAGGHMSYCMRSPFAPGKVPANAGPFWDALVAQLPQLDPRLAALVPFLLRPGALPTDPALGTVFRRLDQLAVETGGDPFPLDERDIRDIADIKPTIHNTYELGYKGLIRDRVLLAADVYFANIENFVGPLRVETPNVFLEPGSVQAFVTNRLATLIQAGVVTQKQVADIIAGLAAVPLGTVVPDQVDDSDLILTYRNFGEVDYWGTDLAAQFLLSDRMRIRGNYSFQSDECFDFDRDGVCTTAGDIALNAPNHKGSVGFTFDDQGAGFSLNGRLRMSGGFPMNSGVYVGDVDSYQVVDAGVGVRLPFQPSTRITLTASNLLDNKHQEFIGAPELGRLLLFRVRYDF